MKVVRSYLFGLIFFGCALVFYVLITAYYAYTDSMIRTIAIETAHLPLLVPHPHGDGDSPSDIGHHIEIESPVFVAPEDLWITGIHADVVNAPDTTLHHALLINIDDTNNSCSLRKGGGRELLAFSQDQMHTNNLDFPDGYALFIPKHSRIVLTAMFHNPEPPVGPGEEYHDVSVRIVLSRARLDSQPLKAVAFRLLHLDDTACIAENGGYSFTVPPKTNEYTYTGPAHGFNPGSMTISRDASIVYVGAHLHGWQGGTWLSLKKNGKEIERFRTELSDSVPYRYDTPHHAAHIPLVAGDILSIEAAYDNPHDVPVHGAMGMAIVWIAEER